MIISKLSIKGSGVWNEDALLAEEDRLVFGVIDGLYVPKPPGETPFNAEEVCAKVVDMGLAEYVEWLVRLEQSDEACLRYPRVKTSDDKTAIWIEL